VFSYILRSLTFNLRLVFRMTMSDKHVAPKLT